VSFSINELKYDIYSKNRLDVLEGLVFVNLNIVCCVWKIRARTASAQSLFYLPHKRLFPLPPLDQRVNYGPAGSVLNQNDMKIENEKYARTGEETR
jgi:hypothetical protein